MPLGTKVKRIKNGFTLTRKTNEADITIVYEGDKITLQGTGDLGHHLIEEVYMLIDKLAEKINYPVNIYRFRKYGE